MEEKINVIKNRISPFVKNSKYVNFTQIDQIAFPSLEKSIDEISSPKPSYTLNSSELFEKATSRGIQKSEKKHYEIKQRIECDDDFMKKWVFKALNDNINWITLDKRETDEEYDQLGK